MRCYECDTEIHDTRGVAFQITGWEMPREQGGTNHVLWREQTGQVMCSNCVLTKKHTGNARQGALL